MRLQVRQRNERRLSTTADVPAVIAFRVERRLRVNLDRNGPLWQFPVLPEQRKSPDRPGWSGWCHEATLRASQETVTEAALVQRHKRVCQSGSVNENGRPTRQCFEKVSRR
jgi:hypothetical protein